MAKEMKHLHLFPTEFPKDQANIILNKIRGIDDGKSVRDRIEAAWWCAGYAASMIPDSHPVMGAAPMSATEFETQLAALAAEGDGVRGLIPWDRIVAKFWELFLAWINGQ